MLTVLFEDPHILVLDKPSGILVHPSPREREGTLLEAVQQRSRPDARLPHRLDRDTSGLMVVALTPAALTHLGNQFLRRTVRKQYLALVAGAVEPDGLTIDAPIGRDRAARPQWNIMPEGRPSVTLLRVVSRHPNLTLLDLTPVTGRTNQLRIHCAHIGHPIAGDVWYSGPPAPRLALHASSLEFSHPATLERVTFHSPLPDVLAALL